MSFVLPLLLLLSAPAQDGGKINWIGKGQDPVSGAIDEASRAGLPILMFFSSEGNPDCVSLSKGAFSHGAVVDASAKMTCIFVECDNGRKNKTLVSKFGLKTYPTLMFFDAAGSPLGLVPQREGPALAAAMRDLLDRTAMRPVFPENVPRALQDARKAGVPLIVYFYDDSAASLSINRSLNDPELKPIRDRFGWSKSEYKKGSELCESLGVDRSPTLLVLDTRLQNPQDKPLARITGSRSPRELRRDLDEALSGLPSAAAADKATGPSTLPLPAPKEKLSDDEVDRKFIKARISVAMDLLKREKVKEALDVLDDVVQTWPKHVETLEAKKLLDQLRKK